LIGHLRRACHSTESEPLDISGVETILALLDATVMLRVAAMAPETSFAKPSPRSYGRRIAKAVVWWLAKKLVPKLKRGDVSLTY
jgi:hypothetical protein